MKFSPYLLLFALLLPGTGSAGLAEVLALAREGKWEEAEAGVAGLGPTAGDVYRWHRLRAGVGTFEDYLDFLTRNGDWPGLVPLRRMGELQITAATSDDDILRYFRNRHAATPHGALLLARALNGQGRYDDARAEIVLAWRMLQFSRSEQAIFQKEFADLLKPHNFARLDRLLWRGQSDQVERMFPFLTPGERALARARIALREKGRGVDARIRAVPEALKDDPGLAFERFLWRLEKGRGAAAREVILERSASAEALGRPAYWSSARRTLAREAMRKGQDRLAYDLAANHHLTGGNDFADLEWLSGYLALTRMDQPELALRHFRAFRAGVDSPISLGRAAYWEAAAYRALDRPVEEATALEFGAEFQTGFYGLLAAQAAGMPMAPEVIDVTPRDIAGAGFFEDPRMLAGVMLADAGEKPLAALFFTHVFDRLPAADQVRLGDLALMLDEPHVAVTLGKLSASRGEVLPRPYFPLAQVENGDVPEELVLAIMRRESEFDPAATSRAGARGLMQLMPRTAAEVAEDLGEEFERGDLLSDPELNTRLGTEYLRFLREEFGGNILLVAAGYNAGPGRTRQWIRTYGDPRAAGADPLEWIETIPFRETRNYVMRVAESVVIYRARLAGEVQEIRLMEELVE